jgi:hypothetical protein
MPGPTTDETTAPAPPDPLAAPATAPDNPSTPAKPEAVKALRAYLMAIAIFYGQCFETDTEKTDEITDSAVICYFLVRMMLEDAIAQYTKNHDPPDPNFMQVALGIPVTPPAAGFRCPKRASKSACAAVNAAFAKYRAAVAVNTQVAGAEAITLNRFSGATQAHSVPGAQLQAAAEKAYSGLVVSTAAAQQAAGTALALTLRKTHLDVQRTKREFQATLKRASTSKGYPGQVIAQLISDHQIASAADLDPVLQGITALPNVPLSTGVGQALPTAATAGVWRSMTPKELAVLIRGLVAQGAITGAAGTALLDELRTIATTSSADARKPLIAKLAQDAGAINAGSPLAGPAGILLAAGASGLG